MKNKFKVLFFTIVLLAFFQNKGISLPSNVYIETGISVEWFYGYTQYQIGGTFEDGSSGGEYRFPLSELVFPINVALTSLDLGISFLEKYSIKATIKHNNLFGAHKANSFSGKMEDSDWGYWYLDSGGASWTDPDSLDIYSESDACLTAIIFDFSFDYMAVKKKIFFLDIGLGILYQNFDYEVKDLDQWYPSYSRYSSYLPSYYSGHTRVDGTVITYRVEYIIPYITLSPGVDVKKKFHFRFSVGLSPCAGALDRDDHVLRKKLSTGESIGVSVLSKLDIDYQFHENVSIGIICNLVYTHTWGIQEQVQYDYYGGDPPGDIGSIDNTVSSFQLSTGLRFGFRF